MFADEDDNLEQSKSVEDVSNEENPQLTAYLTLVQVMRERVITLWIDENYKQIFANQLPFTILEAIRSGLNYGEVAAAMKIGQFLGEQAKQVEAKIPEKPKRVLIPVEVEQVPKIMGHGEGYRKSRRQHQTKLHRRR